MNYQIELTRRNVTVSQFISYIKKGCKQKGIDCGIEKNDFLNPMVPYDTSYRVIDGKKHCYDGDRHYIVDGADAPCVAETCRTKPLDFQTFILNSDGSMYNEICEFTFYDQKSGFGYYYQANKDAK